MSLPALLSLGRAAQAIGVSASTLDRWIRAGEVAATVINGRRYVARGTIEQLAGGHPTHQTGKATTARRTNTPRAQAQPSAALRLLRTN